jgi:hypothetical protein
MNLQHDNLENLIADIRNKFGNLVTYFNLLQISKDNEKMKNISIDKFTLLLKQCENKSYDDINIIRDLLNQFENFDLKNIK